MNFCFGMTVFFLSWPRATGGMSWVCDFFLLSALETALQRGETDTRVLCSSVFVASGRHSIAFQRRDDFDKRGIGVDRLMSCWKEE